jgi:DNA-binding NarL/FixJ family response regulator
MLRTICPGGSIVVLEDSGLLGTAEALEAGAAGCVHFDCSADEFLRAIEAVCASRVGRQRAGRATSVELGSIA